LFRKLSVSELKSIKSIARDLYYLWTIVVACPESVAIVLLLSFVGGLVFLIGGLPTELLTLSFFSELEVAELSAG